MSETNTLFAEEDCPQLPTAPSEKVPTLDAPAPFPASPPRPELSLTAKEIHPEALAVLRDSMDFDGCTVRLTCGELDGRTVFPAIKQVMENLRGAWKGGKVEGFEFPYPPQSLISQVVESGLIPEKNPTDFFPTTGEILETLVAYAALPEAMAYSGATPARVLEPSAGDGRILGAICQEMEIRAAGRTQDSTGRRCVHIDAVEIDPVLAAILREQGYENVYEGDFLKFAPTAFYDRIVMNPPFRTRGVDHAYIDHIYHAWDMLAPGGILVSVVPGGWEAAQDAKRVQFRQWLAENAHLSDPFKKAFQKQGTGITTYIITCLG